MFPILSFHQKSKKIYFYFYVHTEHNLSHTHYHTQLFVEDVIAWLTYTAWSGCHEIVRHEFCLRVKARLTAEFRQNPCRVFMVVAVYVATRALASSSGFFVSSDAHLYSCSQNASILVTFRREHAPENSLHEGLQFGLIVVGPSLDDYSTVPAHIAILLRLRLSIRHF